MPNAFFGLQVPSSNSLAVARVLLAISGRPEAHIDHKPPKASILGTWKAKLPWMPRHTPMALAGLDDSQNWPGAGEEGKDKNGSCWGNPRGVVVECWFLPRGPCMDWFGRVFVANHAVFWLFLCQTLLDMPLPACFYLSPRSLLLRSRSEDQQAKRLELVIRTWKTLIPQKMKALIPRPVEPPTEEPRSWPRRHPKSWHS